VNKQVSTPRNDYLSDFVFETSYYSFNVKIESEYNFRVVFYQTAKIKMFNLYFQVYLPITQHVVITIRSRFATIIIVVSEKVQ
jgi:hypothetical protein